MSDYKIWEMGMDEIKPYENNPRFNNRAVSEVANSIAAFGFKQPIVVDKGHVIIVGHTRYLAAQSLGLDTVPVIVAEDLTPQEAKAYRLADNKVSEKSSWDQEALEKELLGLADLDMHRFGFDEIDLSDLHNSMPDDLGDLAGETDGSRSGDVDAGSLYILGRHRLLCGDATNEEDYKKLMGKEMATLVLTDPPYGVSLEQSIKQQRKLRSYSRPGIRESDHIAHDNLRGDDLERFLAQSFKGAFKYLVPGGGVLCLVCE